ncbi:matrixin family metalloprotease [Candidatus Berkelbacteria bacterium]|nr:matrixin family metalloprotease [Candidatus Berkelbacteria bacterium]
MKNTRFILVALWAAVLVALPLSSADAFSYAGYRWKGTFPTVGMDLRGLNLTSWKSSAKTVMSEWNSKEARFLFYSNDSSANKAYVYYDYYGNLAFAKIYTYPFTKTIYKAHVYVNNFYSYNPPYTWGTWYDLKTVLRHEYGHLLKLEHNGNSSSLMYASIPPKTVKYIGTDEVNGIRYIYGRR